MTKILFFGRLAGLEADMPDTPVGSDAFRLAIEAQLPQLAAPGINMAVNQQIVRADIVIQPDDEVAFLPPMSGG